MVTPIEIENPVTMDSIERKNDEESAIKEKDEGVNRGRSIS
jgi:hypothetical protein